jgi:hypothetical protein
LRSRKRRAGRHPLAAPKSKIENQKSKIENPPAGRQVEN